MIGTARKLERERENKTRGIWRKGGSGNSPFRPLSRSLEQARGDGDHSPGIKYHIKSQVMGSSSTVVLRDQRLLHLSYLSIHLITFAIVIYQSNRSFNIHPPGQPPGHLTLLKIGLFKFPPLGAKKLFKCRTYYF